MEIHNIQALCLSKPKVKETHPFGDWPICYKVAGKIFAQVYPDKITLKCTRFAGELFRQQYPGVVVRGYHCPPVQQPYWNTIDLARFPEEELPYMIDLAWETVVSQLPKKMQKQIVEDATQSCAIVGGSNRPNLVL